MADIFSVLLCAGGTLEIAPIFSIPKAGNQIRGWISGKRKRSGGHFTGSLKSKRYQPKEGDGAPFEWNFNRVKNSLENE